MTLNDLKARINAIEEGYEFFLAYAAQGLAGDQAGKSGEQVREYLHGFEEALDGLAEAFGPICRVARPPKTCWTCSGAMPRPPGPCSCGWWRPSPPFHPS